MAATGVHVLIVGGVSVNDPGGHDKFPYNFINPAVRRAIAFKGNSHILFYAPAYEMRVDKQKKEHSSVTITMIDDCYLPLPVNQCHPYLVRKIKNPNHFLDVLNGSATRHGIKVQTIKSATDLTNALNAFEAIETVHYFGHSSKELMFLQYSTTGREPAVGEVVWGKTEAANVAPSKFTTNATFASYGCFQGESGGLAEDVRKLWKIRAIGSEGKTDFETIGQGQTFPTSAGGYQEFPAPTLGSDGRTWTYASRRALATPF